MPGKKIKPSDRVSNIAKRSSSSSSMLSLTPSQLNTAIMEMLSMRQAATRCDAVCRGNYYSNITVINIMRIMCLPSLYCTDEITYSLAFCSFNPVCIDQRSYVIALATEIQVSVAGNSEAVSTPLLYSSFHLTTSFLVEEQIIRCHNF